MNQTVQSHKQFILSKLNIYMYFEGKQIDTCADPESFVRVVQLRQRFFKSFFFFFFFFSFEGREDSNAKLV